MESSRRDDPPIKVVDRRWWARGEHEGEAPAEEATRKPTVVEDLELQLADARARVQELMTGHRQALDEFEQVKVRLRRDVAREVERGRRVLLAELLDVVDNLDRAVSAAADGTPVPSDQLGRGVALVRDIVAAVGLKSTTTGDTLCDEKKPIILERMVFPEPVISLAIEPKTKADQEKLGQGMAKLMAEDPTFRVTTDEQTGQVVIAGMGELHLEIIVDRMKREFGVEANVGKPQVAYRETIRKAVTDIEGKFVRQSGGKGQYGHVVLSLEPQTPGKGFEFVDAIKGGVVPREFIPAVRKGVEESLPAGVLAGYPVVDVKVTLTFGSYHEVDSNENAFKMAASFGFKDGCRKASPVILEPMMAVEVETPEDYAGSVMGDLSSRRGMVQGMDDMPGGGKVIKAEVPLSEMFGYSTTLRSMSQGRATYTMEFKHYTEAPKNVADAIITSRAK